MNASKLMTVNSRYMPGNASDLLLYGLLLYTILFYSQIAGRYPVLEAIRLELILGTILVIVAFKKIISGAVDFKENKLNFGALLFISIAFITIPFALVKTRALDTFISLFKFFAIYLMIISTINSEKKLKLFIYVYLGMITLLFVEPFILSLAGKGFIFNNHMWRLAGVTGYFAHPNQLGGIAAENLPFYYFLMKWEKSKIKKLLYFVLIIIAIRVVMLTQSRTGFLGVIGFICLLWFFSRRKMISMVLICLCCVGLWQWAPQETRNRFLTLSEVKRVITLEQLSEEDHQELGSMVSRQELIRRGLIAFQENPILGVGLSCFISFNGQRWGYWFPPHNTYIQALAEMGMVGFIAFIYVIFISFKNLRNVKNILRTTGETNSFVASITSAVTIYLMLRIIVSMFGQDLYANYWWVAGGLSLVLLRIVKEKYENALTDNLEEVGL